MSFYPHSRYYCNISSTSKARTSYPKTLSVCRRYGLLAPILTPDDGTNLRVCAYIHFCRMPQNEGGWMGVGEVEKLSRVIVLNAQTDTKVTPEIRSGTSATRNLRVQLPNRNDTWQLRPITIITIPIGLLMNEWSYAVVYRVFPRRGKTIDLV